MRYLPIMLMAITLCGCDSSAKRAARQQFREAVAAVAVCAQGSTYQEFREKRMALDACYAANKAYLSEAGGAFNKLTVLMDSTDTIWRYEIDGDSEITSQKYVDYMASNRETLEQLREMGRLVPANTAVQELDMRANIAKSQLDFLNAARMHFIETSGFLDGNPEAISVFVQLFGGNKEQTLPGGRKSQWNTPLWSAMLVLNPNVLKKADFTVDQRLADRDFTVGYYVGIGLFQIGKQCDLILK